MRKQANGKVSQWEGLLILTNIEITIHYYAITSLLHHYYIILITFSLDYNVRVVLLQEKRGSDCIFLIIIMIITYSQKFPGSFPEVSRKFSGSISSEVRGRVCQCYLSIRLGGDSMIRRITMVTDIILRIIYLLSQCSSILIRRTTMIIDISLRII